MLGLGKNNELFGTVVPPARWDRDAILFVNGVTKFAGEEFLWLRGRVHTPAERCAISIHFPPLLTTLRARGQYKLILVAPLFPSRKLPHDSSPQPRLYPRPLRHVFRRPR